MDGISAAKAAALYAAVKAGRLIDAADLVVNRIDDLLLSGDFKTCDAIFETLDLGLLDTHAIISVLAATLPAASQLPGRQRFGAKCAAHLSTFEPPARVAGLLRGLLPNEVDGRSNDDRALFDME